jgi:hypothetical protein
MDPNANLTEQRKLSALLMYQTENDRPVDLIDVLRLAELVIALDEWIARGGFLPDAWRA